MRPLVLLTDSSHPRRNIEAENIYYQAEIFLLEIEIHVRTKYPFVSP
jgi:hypothetical protein